MSRWVVPIVAASLLLVAGLSGAGTLVIHANTSDPAPKAAFEGMVRDFEAAHPEVEVRLRVYDHEAFKPAIRQFLVFDAPDVVTWFAGNRMRFFVERGLFEDVSDVWEAHGLARSMGASRALMSVDGRQYGVPYTRYQWGLYYRKDLFARHGIEVPASWEAFLAACQTLADNGVTPIAIGTKPLWPAAGWFDYLNLRINGLAFHLDLTAGKVPYTDRRVRRVLEHWRRLLEYDYFVADHAAMSWQQALGMLTDGRAAMYLIGNFAVPLLGNAVDRIGFFPFPVIDPDVPRYEDAPTDTVHIPAHAANKDDARRFLAFLARADTQGRMNETLGQLPVNEDAGRPDDPFLAAGAALLDSAAGLAQFYDRDTDPAMAQIGMLGFRKFMRSPASLDTILRRLETERRRIYEVRRPPGGS